MHKQSCIRTLTFGSSETFDMCVLIILMLYQRYKCQCDATLTLAEGTLSLRGGWRGGKYEMKDRKKDKKKKER